MHFGTAELKDHRRTRRLVQTADALVRHPGGSLPEKLKAPQKLEALYRLMRCEHVTHESVLKSHRERTWEQISAGTGPVLVIHDTTELDFTTHESLRNDLGEIGNGSRRGYLCHNSLAVDPESGEVLGLANQVLHHRTKVGPHEKQTQRRKRASRESRLWLQGTETLPADERLVDVCDRGADTFEFLEHEDHSGRRFVIRSCYSRSIRTAHDEKAPRGRLHEFARALPAISEYTIRVQPKWVERKPKRKGTKKRVRRRGREARLLVAAAPVLVRAPASKNGEHGNQPLPLWVVRVWEPDPPAGEEGLEWFLLTNRPVETAEEAREVVSWYTRRWIVEEYHKAMKTGCGIENPQFTREQRLQPMIALLSVVALTLLNLRELSRHPEAKTQPATDVVSEDYVKLLSAWRHKRIKKDWTIHEFFYALARLGGHQNRKHDHRPGWLVLWRGWIQLQAMLDGAEAITELERCA